MQVYDIIQLLYNLKNFAVISSTITSKYKIYFLQHEYVHKHKKSHTENANVTCKTDKVF